MVTEDQSPELAKFMRWWATHTELVFDFGNLYAATFLYLRTYPGRSHPWIQEMIRVLADLSRDRDLGRLVAARFPDLYRALVDAPPGETS